MRTATDELERDHKLIEHSQRGRLTHTQVLQSLVALYPAQIWKEDYLLFPMADNILDESDHEALLRQFAIAENALGTDAHDRFETLAQDLAKRVDHCPQCDQSARRA